jgi:hypothetical protein
MKRLLMALVVGHAAGLGLLLWSSAPVDAQATECGGATMVLEGGTPTPFVLPASRDETLRVEPGAVLLVTSRQPGTAPQQSEVRITVSGLGLSFDFTADLGPGASPDPAQIELPMRYPPTFVGCIVSTGLWSATAPPSVR